MENTARKTHPLIIVAAVAVTAASIAAIAHFTGLLPAKSGPDSPSTVSTAQPDTGDGAIPAPPAGTPPPICGECGTVQSLRTVTTPGEGTGVGAVAGGALGGLLGHQIGGGSGNTVATIAGAVGGAVAGHQVEKQARTGESREVVVRFEDGSTRGFKQDGATRWQVGDRVRLVNGSLQPN